MEVMMCICVVVVVVLLFHQSKSAGLFTPKDNYLIDCGSTRNTSVDGRTFTSDSSSSLVSTKQQNFVSATKSNTSTPVPSDLYLTARVFTQESSYTFNVQLKGRHWVRLYFFPVPSTNYNLKTANFTVTTQDFVLLHDFGIRDSSYVFKEYLINLTLDTLVLTFTPSNNSMAYVNAIEVISVPDDLISDTAQSVQPLATYSGLTTRAFETIYRLNMGGPKLTPFNDTLWRTWEPDLNFLDSKSAAKNFSINANLIHYNNTVVTPEIAPNLVYATCEEMATANVTNANFNVSWKFTVDPHYIYFIRLHFCDIVSEALNLLLFNVYINTNSALNDFQIPTQLAEPYYVDFVTNVSAGSNNLNITIGPLDVGSVAANAILNGLEIMKMNNARGSLDGVSSTNGLVMVRSKRTNKVGPIVGSTVGAFTALLLITVVILFCHSKSNRKRSTTTWFPLTVHGGNSETIGSKGSKVSNGTNVSSGPSSLGRHFAFAEIQEATNNFDESLILGVGGFGKVFKGVLEDGTQVAVKRGNPSSEQGLAEFQTEIQMLSKLRHRHLVSLIGYCQEHSEMILVYECMGNGPLRSHLYGSDLPALSWKQRLEICIGSARGLHYLHTGAAQGIIHRDVKTTNILLDENLVAKVADFGLSKTGPALDETHVSTAVKGSFGYLDPEYFRRQQLTEKSDVYSFGVVLLEVLCARPAINPSLPREQVNIAEWAMHWQRKGMLEQIIDPHLVGTVDPNSLRKFGETAEKCLAEQGIDRPTMGDVLWNLEYAFQLQETAMLNDQDENSTNRIAELPLRFHQSSFVDNSIMDRSSVASEEGSEGTTTSAVFSQLVNPKGR